MRVAGLLVGGLVLVGAGIAVIAAGVPGRWVLGPVLIAGGLALKALGLVLDLAGPPAGRTATRLGTARAPAGRPQTGQASRRQAASQNIHS